MHRSLLFLQTLNTVVLMQCSCSCSFIACILSRRWKDTNPFWIDLFPSTYDLDHGTCCNIEVRVLCILCELSSIA